MRTNRPWRRRRSAGAVRTGNEWPENKNWEVRYEAKKTGKSKGAVKAGDIVRDERFEIAVERADLERFGMVAVTVTAEVEAHDPEALRQ